MKKVKSYITFLLLLLGFHFSVYAQPNYLFTDISGSFTYHSLSDLGSFRQYTVAASGTHSNEWAFLVNNNFGSCVAPNCAVWRHYTPGGALMPFNTSIQPNAGSNYGALYNDNSVGFLNGSASFTQSTTNGRYYTFNFVENGAANSWFSILETTFAPNNLTGTPSVNTGGTLTITGLPPTLNSGENLFCRYSVNGFLTSGIVLVNVTGTTGTAQIPVQNQGATVNYYFYTSNKTSGVINADVAANGQFVHDLSTLRVLNNGGSNYSFTFGGPVIVLSSTGTITTATPYSNLKAAFDEINLAVSHTGNIQIFINGNTTETASADLNITASYSALSIQPAGGSSKTVSGTLNASLVRLNGADNVLIDGMNSGGNSLTFENTQSTGTGIATLTFLNDASGNTLQNCIFKGATATATLGVIVLNNGAGVTGNDNNVIQNNIITASGANLPFNGIYSGATPAAVTINNNVSILNNYIYDYYNPGAECGGILCANGNADWTISGNHFYQTATRTATASTTTFTGIDVQNNATDNFLISGNYIGGSAPFCAGTPLTLMNGAGGPVLRAIKCNNSTVVGTSIQGNTISNISITTTSTSNAQCGISLVTGKFFVGNLTGNIINNIAFSYNPSGATVGFFSGIFAGTGTGDNIIIQNNTIKQITVSSSLSKVADIRAINLQSGTFTINQNKIGGNLPAEELLNTTTGNVNGIYASVTTASPQLIQGNKIQRLRSNAASAGSVYGINLINSGATYAILNDTIKNLASATSFINAINSSVSTAALHTIQGNVIDSISSGIATITHIGIRLSITGGSYNVKNNIIRNFSNALGNVNAIQFASTATATTDSISNNTISDISGLVVNGLYVFNTGPVYQVHNNSIRKLSGESGNGIYFALGAGNAAVGIGNNTIDSVYSTAIIPGLYNVRGIWLSGTGGTFTVQGNQIVNLFGTNANLFGISTDVNASANSHSISGNTISRMFNTHLGASLLNTTALNVSSNGNYTLNQNQIYNLISSSPILAFGASTSGILFTATGNSQVISKNSVWNVVNSNATAMAGVMGIYYASISGGLNLISGNTVHSLNLSSSSPLSQMYGIYVNTGQVSVVNNMVRLGLDKNGSSITSGYGITGIADGAGANLYYHNSVYIGGNNVTAGSPTFAFGSNSSGTRNIRNNVFMNARSHAVTSPAIKHYAIGLNSNSGLTLDYNAYYTTGTDGYTGNYASAPIQDFCSWKAIVLQDVFSLWGDPNFVNPVGDSSAVNLHINSPTSVEGKGTAGLASVDYDNDTRNTPPDLGADEGSFTLVSPFVVSVTLGTFPVICAGTTGASLPYTVLSGAPTLYSISATAPSPMPGFLQVNNAPLTASPLTIALPNGVTGGSYNFIVTFRNPVYCVSATYSFVITVHEPSLTVTNPAPVCSPSVINLTAPAVTAGSTLNGGALTYWENAGATIPLSNSNAVGTSGIYYIKVTTSANCTDIEPVNVTINPSPTLVITNPAVACAPSTVNLTLPAVTAGSTLNGGSLSYWENAGATIVLNNPNAVSVSNTYYIKCQTAAGCTDIEPVSVTVNSTPVTAPVTTEACTYASISSTVTLTATGSGGTITWFNNPLHSGLPLGIGGSYVASTSATYYAFIDNGGCFSAGSPAIANIRSTPSQNIPVAPGDYWATHAVAQGGWTHYCNCEDDYLLVSLDLNGQNIGSNLVNTAVVPGNVGNQYSVNMHIIPGNAVHIPASVPYVDAVLNPNGWWIMPRTWDVYPHTQPTSTVNVRSYYKDVDFNNLNTAIVAAGSVAIPSESELTAYKLTGFNASIKLGDQHSGLTQNDILLWGSNPYLPPWTGGTNAPAFPSVHYFQYPITSFSGGGGGGGSNGNPPLPVTLSTFNGKNIGNKNVLYWTTELESNLSHFEIEKEGNAQTNFVNIGTVSAKGGIHSSADYTFTDYTPAEGENLYRLKMVDINGIFQYSPVISLHYGTAFRYAVYPNPAQNQLFLSTSGENGVAIFGLYQADGREVFRWKGNLEDNPILNFDVSTLAKGIYHYQIVLGEEIYHGKCVIE